MPKTSFLVTYHRYLRYGWVILLSVILAIPVTSWILHTTFSDAVGSTFFTLKLLGQITGILGCQLFAFALILSARLSFIEKLFGGLDKMYVIHHRIGTIAFAFLAVHPLILAFRYLDDGFASVASFLSPIGNTLPATLGLISLYGMMTLLFLTFYGSVFMYPTLKLAHRFLGMFFFFGFLHVLLIPSSLSSDGTLKASLLITAFLGLVAFTYRTLLGKWIVPRHNFRVSSVIDLGGQMTEITLTPKGKGMYHLPGQFGMLTLPATKGVLDEEHPFTLSSRGDDGTVRFSVKALGDYTSTLPLTKVGDEALVEGPFGEFSYIYGKEKQVWVAGGIGVTPFVSMAEYMLTLDTLPYTIDFFYSVKTASDAVYEDLFKKLEEKHTSFRYHPMPSDTAGFISAEVLLSQVKDLHKRDIFVCGPPGLMSALSSQLQAIGVALKNVHTERFALLK
jgi:predicted ferric reductase